MAETSPVSARTDRLLAGGKIHFSSGSFQGALPSMLEACESEGLGGIEFSSGLPFAPDLLDQSRAALSRPLSLLVHNYFPPPREPFVLNLAASDPEILTASHALCRTAIELCREVGAPFYSVHSGFAMKLKASQLGRPDAQAALDRELLIDRAAAERTFAESVAKLSTYARECGVGLLLENNVITRQQVAAGRADSLLMTSPAEVRAFLETLGDDNVGLLLDVAHAKVAAGALGFDPAEFFALPSGQIRALHLSDNDGTTDSNQPFTAEAWFASHLPKFQHLPVVIEVYRLDAARRRQQLDTLTALLTSSSCP